MMDLKSTSLIQCAKFARCYGTRSARPLPRPARPPVKYPDPLMNNPHATVTPLDNGVTLIRRPPPTAPSPLSTSVLPASPLLRPLRTGTASTLLMSSPSSSSLASLKSSSSGISNSKLPGSVPPPVRRSLRQRILGDKEFAEIRRLRASNPSYYTRSRLAKQFNVPEMLIGMAAPLDKASKVEAKSKMEAKHESVREKWGERKELLMAIRKKRKQFW